MPTTQPKQLRLITAGFFFLSGLITASWSSRIPDIQQKLGLDNAAWGTVLVAPPLGLLTGMLASSWLVERFGTRRIMLVSCLACTAILCLLGLMPSRGGLMATLFCLGMARTVLNISMNTNSMEIQRLYDRPIISTFHGIWSTACLTAAGIGQLMIILNLAPAFHFSIMSALCAVAALLLHPKDPPSQQAKTEKRPFFVAPDRYLFLLGVVAFCAMLAESAMFDWSINYFENTVGVKKSLVTAGLVCFTITMSLGRLLGDRLIHRFGHLQMLMINGLLMSAGFFISALFPYLVPALLGFLLIGIGDSIVVPIAYTLAARSQKMKPSYAIACVSLIGASGFIIGPLLMGTISEWLGMQCAVAVVGGVAVVVSVVARMLGQMTEDR